MAGWEPPATLPEFRYTNYESNESVFNWVLDSKRNYTEEGDSMVAMDYRADEFFVGSDLYVGLVASRTGSDLDARLAYLLKTLALDAATPISRDVPAAPTGGAPGWSKSNTKIPLNWPASNLPVDVRNNRGAMRGAIVVISYLTVPTTTVRVHRMDAAYDPTQGE
jgi:hypothetical protein